MDEAFRVSCVGRGEDHRALLPNGDGMSVVDGCGRVQPQPGVPVLVVVPTEDRLPKRSGILDASEASGKSGRYFIVLKYDSEYGLMLLCFVKRPRRHRPVDRPSPGRRRQ